MNRLLAAALLGGISILMLAGLGRVDAVPPAHAAATALPPVAADAAVADAPRECSNAGNVTTGCTYQ